MEINLYHTRKEAKVIVNNSNKEFSADLINKLKIDIYNEVTSVILYADEYAFDQKDIRIVNKETGVPVLTSNFYHAILLNIFGNSFDDQFALIDDNVEYFNFKEACKIGLSMTFDYKIGDIPKLISTDNAFIEKVVSRNIETFNTIEHLKRCLGIEYTESTGEVKHIPGLREVYKLSKKHEDKFFKIKELIEELKQDNIRLVFNSSYEQLIPVDHNKFKVIYSDDISKGANKYFDCIPKEYIIKDVYYMTEEDDITDR